MHDVIIVGGSYSGAAAALQLARARRSVLVIDAGQRRNRFASHSHGFLTRDGQDPAEIAAEARRQVSAYPTVEWREASAVSAGGGVDNFHVELADGTRHSARRLILATGVRDVLPDVPGLAEQWGRTVFHCPYCHGYELDRAPVGVLAAGPHSLHHALMLPDWGPTTLFLNDRWEPDAEAFAKIAARGTGIERTPVRQMRPGGAGIAVDLVDGRSVELAGLFVAPRLEQASPLAEQLGCEIEHGVMGATVKTDAFKATGVAGVFACGDAARAAGSVTFAVSEGAQAGLACHASLMFGAT